MIQERNAAVQSFLENCANIHNNRDVSEKKYNAVAHCIEEILCAQNNLITPFLPLKEIWLPIALQIVKKLQQWTANGKDVGVREQFSDVICEKSPPLR